MPTKTQTLMSKSFSLSDFDFALPEELIAQHPSPERSASRLLDGRHAGGEKSEKGERDLIFRQLPELLRSGDLLVFNDTKVVKARLFGQKISGGKLELLIERVQGNNEVLAQMRVSKKPSAGARLHISGGIRRGGFDAIVLGRWPDANGDLFHLRLESPNQDEDAWALMQRCGHLPLPPYIQRSYETKDADEDLQRYQSVFARVPGAVAAPTASLHFDDELVAALKTRGIETANVTLHVGAGTFQPVKSENLSEHKMHSERYEIPLDTLAALERCRQREGRIVAVGTTSVRALESWAQTGERAGETRIFITPGFEFQVADLLLTNFHLPKSTLMMLVSAFAGYEHIRALYAHAIEKNYRFFSYGDAMLLNRLRE